MLCCVVQRALVNMTQVAEHINAMKKKYDAAVHVQEVQNLIRGWEVRWATLYLGGHVHARLWFTASLYLLSACTCLVHCQFSLSTLCVHECGRGVVIGRVSLFVSRSRKCSMRRHCVH